MEQNQPSPLPSPPHSSSVKTTADRQGEGKKNSKPVNFFLLFELGIEFAVILALPLIGGVYLGKWLDAKYGTKFIIIICILVALALSWYVMLRKIMDVRKLIK